jgi:hypothetical protein
MTSLRTKTVVAVMAQVLCLTTVVSSAAPAKEASEAEVIALIQPPAYTDLIGVQVVYRSILHEHVRRAMLLERCAALDRRFPKAASAAFVSVLTKSENWALRKDHSLSKARFGLEDEMLSLQAAMVRNGLSDTDFAAWMAFKTSDTGRRAIGIEAMLSGIDAAGARLVDVMTGTPWDWPLERLRRLADATGHRAPFDATLEHFQRGSAAEVARLIGDPTQMMDEAVSSALARAFEKGSFAREFLSRLPPADLKAYRQSQAEPVSTKLAKAQEAIAGILQRDGAGLSSFCKRSGLLHCEPGSPVAAKAQALRTRFEEADQDDFGLKPLRELIRKLPEAACSAR